MIGAVVQSYVLEYFGRGERIAVALTKVGGVETSILFNEEQLCRYSLSHERIRAFEVCRQRTPGKGNRRQAAGGNAWTVHDVSVRFGCAFCR